MWRRMILPGGEGGRSREPGARMGEHSQPRNQWGGSRLPRVTHDDRCRAVVEDHAALLISASGSVRKKEALCRIGKGSDAYQKISARPLQLAGKHDVVECARLLEGGSRIVASPTDHLHVASEIQSARRIELLLSKNARTDLRVVDGRSFLPLEFALMSTRVQTNCTLQNQIEDLLSDVKQSDLKAVRLLAEKTRVVGELAYRYAMEGNVPALAILLLVVEQKISSQVSVVIECIRTKRSIYNSIVDEALSMGDASVCDGNERRKALLCEIQLLNQFGLASWRDHNDRTLPTLLRAAKVGDMNVINMLMMGNVNVDEANFKGNTVLHRCLSGASCAKEPRIVWLLLKNGARVFLGRPLLRLEIALTIHRNWSSQNVEKLLVMNVIAELDQIPKFSAMATLFLGLLLPNEAIVFQLIKTGLTPVHRAFAKALQSLLLHAQGCVDIPSETGVAPFFALTSIRKQGTIDDMTSKNNPPTIDGVSKSKPISKHVNIHFCDKRFRISPISHDSSVINFVYSVLLENKILTKDFYLKMNGRILDNHTLICVILLEEEPTIQVCPRLRGGVHPYYQITYQRFHEIQNHNVANLHRTATIPQNLTSPTGSTNATFLSSISHRMLHGLLAHVLSDGHLTRGVTWGGRFTMKDVLMSADGHVMVSPEIQPNQYTDAGGELDYNALHAIALSFARDQSNNKISPVHFDHLLKLLRSSKDNQRRSKMFVFFLVGHPSLLIYCEKYKLYGLVHLLLGRITPTESTNLDTWLLSNSGGHDNWPLLVAPTSLFHNTYTYKGQIRYKQGLRQGFRFGRNYEAHPPSGVLNSLAEDALDHVFFFLLTIVIEGLVKTLPEPSQSADDLIDIISNLKADPATVRKFWPPPQVQAP